MKTAAEIRAAIKAGEIKRGGGDGTGGVGAGVFGVMIDAAEFAAGENGNLRGKMVCRVVDAQDPATIGKKFNYYIQTKNAEYLERSLAEFSEHCAVWGVSEERIYDRAESAEDIIGNMMIEIQRLAIKGQLGGVIERKDSGKMNPKGKPYFWCDIKEVGLVGSTSAAPATAAPAATTPAVTPAMPSGPAAPAAPAVAQAAAAPAPVRKPWQRG